MNITRAILDVIRRSAKADLAPGLSSSELAAVEVRFGICFPPDLRDLLAGGVPTGRGWPDWRAAAADPSGAAAREIDEQLDWPREGMSFDVEHNSFWDPEWGVRPALVSDAVRIAEAAVNAAPRLIPIYGHRYLPAEPGIAGNPVLSVYQTDIIVYGRDLLSYFKAETTGWTDALAGGEVRVIRSWTRWMDGSWPRR